MSTQSRSKVRWYRSGDNYVRYLKHTKYLRIEQEVELLSIFIGFEDSNRYTVKDESGRNIFHVVEETNCLSRHCCGHDRGFKLNILGLDGRVILVVDRDLRICYGWIEKLCCPDKMKVSTPDGQVLGYVKLMFSCFKPSFEIQDSSGETKLILEGPCLMCPCPYSNHEFQLKTPEGHDIGSVTKQWSGFVKEIFTDSDNFFVSFPADLDVTIKAVCMSAAFLVDFRYFEFSRRRKFSTSIFGIMNKM